MSTLYFYEFESCRCIVDQTTHTYRQSNNYTWTVINMYVCVCACEFTDGVNFMPTMQQTYKVVNNANASPMKSSISNGKSVQRCTTKLPPRRCCNFASIGCSGDRCRSGLWKFQLNCRRLLLLLTWHANCGYAAFPNNNNKLSKFLQIVFVYVCVCLGGCGVYLHSIQQL